METALTVLAVSLLCLAGAVAVLGSSVPFLYWKCFRLEWRLAEEVKELGRQIDALDEAMDRLLERVGVPAEGGKE